MQKRTLAYVLALSTLTLGALGSAALADRTRDGHGMMGMECGPMGGGFGAGPGFDFDALDADKDGKVTADEFGEQRKARIAGLDANADGKISADELVTMQMKGAEERAKTRADHMIAAMDADGDKALSAAELLAMPAGNMRGMERMDADEDGAVSRAEFDAAQAGMGQGMKGMGEGRGKGHGMGGGYGMGQGQQMGNGAGMMPGGCNN